MAIINHLGTVVVGIGDLPPPKSGLSAVRVDFEITVVCDASLQVQGAPVTCVLRSLDLSRAGSFNRSLRQLNSSIHSHRARQEEAVEGWCAQASVP